MTNIITVNIEHEETQAKDKTEDLFELNEIIASRDCRRCTDLLNDKRHIYQNQSSVIRFCDLFTVDDFASSLMPDDVDRDLVPVKTRGDGNCLYNSASLCITGDESLSTTLRLLVAAKFFLNRNYYANHPHLTKTSEEPKMFSDQGYTIFFIILSDEASFQYDCSRNRQMSIEKEALLPCQDGNWSSMIHILALSSVLGVLIRSVYPELNEGIRPMFHAEAEQILPRDASHSSSEWCVNIMWSRDGNLESTPGLTFQPNHFVGLLAARNYGNDATSSPNDAIRSERPRSESTVCDICDVITNNSANELSNEQKANFKHE